MGIENYLDRLLAGEELPPPSEHEDPALDKLRQLAARMRRDQEQLESQHQAFGELATALMQLAQLDFDISLAADHDDDLLNATFIGLSMMAEELAHSHRELERARDAALAASRSKSTFLANMSHELRTPLNAIIGYCELLIDDCSQQPELATQTDDLNRILSAGRHLLNLLSDVLDLSKIEAGRVEVDLERMKLAPLVEDVADTLRSSATNKGLELVVDIVDDPDVNADPLRLKQALINLVGNAVKFTSQGSVTVRLQRVGRMVQVSVIDTGIGIDPARLQAIFEPFTQAEKSTAREFGGTGLGLAISRQLARIMGGDLLASSIKGQGSEFVVELPEVRVVLTDVNGQSRRATLLLVDDDPTFHDLVRRQLVHLDCQIISATTGQQALSVVETTRPDLIILDIVMPTLDGWSTLTQLKARPELADIPVVMVSVYDATSDARPLQAADFLVKPVPREALVRTVSRYLGPGGRSVLIVDDEEAARTLARRQLERSGFRIAEASNGEEALQRAGHERPDLVLMDLKMPVMDGFACAGAFQRDPRLCDIPIVVLTSLDLTADDREQLAGRVANIVRKGRSSSALLGAIREALGSF